MSSYKLVALDMDGTLLDDNLEISKKNKDSIINLVNKGTHVILATGRTFKAASFYAKELNLDIPIITYNGSLIKEVITEKILYSRHISNNVAREILKVGEELDVYIKVYIDDVLYIEGEVEEAVSFSRNHRIDYKVIGKLSENINKDPYMIVFKDDTRKINKIIEYLKKSKDLPVSFTLSTPNSLEIMDKGVSKANALEYLTNKLGIQSNEVIAVGNSLNDYEMISWAGLGIAMKNSDKQLLDKWDTISKYDNNEDGISHILAEKFYKGGINYA
ncbi:Cof-type HAD-IIB family hydrolase [Sporosalibacterium faouarense]|uniref:Cof-type HAD-IIB family hydrolase n=1 Tax=Sporosalibacterium faouarense TaxID=516123 RepID=UPI00141CE91A|nr:HAD family phosphatase [Bacillota bacterium]